jgi:hypothetical protein
MMPGMNGAELVCAFAERFPACRAMLMTANQWASEICINGSRIKVLQKPFEMKEIFRFLAGASDRIDILCCLGWPSGLLLNML